MRDDLLGFVLGALDASEHEKIQRRLEQDAQLQQQLKHVQRGLELLQWDRQQIAPPAGLATRTCQLIREISGSPAGPCVGPEVEPSREFLLTPAARREAASDPPRVWTLADFVVAAGVCLAAACLFFPAIVASRYHSQLTVCANNLGELGQALAMYSQHDPRGLIPVVPASGNAAFAGVWVPKLLEKGLIDNELLVRCPARGEKTLVVQIPTLNEIYKAQGPQLRRMHRVTGGDYAYRFGWMKDGRLQGIRYQGQTNSPLLADNPLDQALESCISSHGRGQNVLFEDGHVAFLTTRHRPGVERDDMFVNDLGLLEPGLHQNDCVLAPSPVSPVPVSWQADIASPDR